jgi:hypothetical protein
MNKETMKANGMGLREDCIYIYRIKGMNYNPETNNVEYQLTKEHIFIDKGRAIYWAGFTNHYVLIGFMRSVFSPEGRADVLQTSRNLGDHFVFGNHKFMAIWTGVWEPIEREGLVCITFQTSVFESMINEVFTCMKENGGKLVDRN